MADLDLMATNITTLLGQVSGINKAYDHEGQGMTNFPLATLYWDGFGQTDDTTMRKQVNWRWIIRLYVSIRLSDISVPQKEIRTLTQAAIQKLRTDPSLGGTCLWHNISNGEIFAVLDQNNPLMVAELTLEATTEES
jgi:hypothetical protein